MPAILRPLGVALLLLHFSTGFVAAAPSCEITFALKNSVTVGSMTAVVQYAGAGGEFSGSGQSPDCAAISPVQGNFVDDDLVNKFLTLVVYRLPGGFSGPRDFARCTFVPAGAAPTPASFPMFIQLAIGPTGQPVSPSVGVSKISCSGIVTTTTSTSTTITSTTTTTLPPFGCGDPQGDGIRASDALYVLLSALGLEICDNCICDADGNGSQAASDALRVLKVAVGQNIPLLCPLCN